MPNPIFQIIKLHFDSFNNAHFETEELEQKSTGAKYYFIKPKKEEKETHIFRIKAEDYHLVERHITVFEDLKEEEGDGHAAYHLTMKVSNPQTRASYFIRTYHNVVGNILYVNCKDENEVHANLSGNDNTLYSARLVMMQFNQFIQDIYQDMNSEASRKHEQQVKSLEIVSESLTDKQSDQYKDKLKSYDSILVAVINHMEEWHAFNFNPNITLFRHFCNLRELIKKQIADLTEATKQAPKAILPPDEKKEAKENKDVVTIGEQKTVAIAPRLSKAEQIIQEYERVTQEANQVPEGRQYFKCILRLKQLDKLAHEEFTRLLDAGSEYRIIPRAALEGLLSIISMIDIADFSLAVKNKRHLALELMTKQCDYVLGEATVLLEEAYHRKDKVSFELLLKAKVPCDYLNAERRTLLIRACFDGRKEEMILLLQIGQASQYFKCYQGFSALGYLTMLEEKKPNLDLVRAFLNNCSDLQIDFMQGVDGMASPPLAFACSKNWKEAMKVLLEYGANPCCVRTTDHLSALAICAAKGYVGLVTIILEKSKHPLDSAYARALQAARQWGHKQIEKMLLERAGSVEPNANVTKFLYPVGTPFSDLFRMFTREGRASLGAPAEIKRLTQSRHHD